MHGYFLLDLLFSQPPQVPYDNLLRDFYCQNFFFHQFRRKLLLHKEFLSIFSYLFFNINKRNFQKKGHWVEIQCYFFEKDVTKSNDSLQSVLTRTSLKRGKTTSAHACISPQTSLFFLFFALSRHLKLRLYPLPLFHPIFSRPHRTSFTVPVTAIIFFLRFSPHQLSMSVSWLLFFSNQDRALTPSPHIPLW